MSANLIATISKKSTDAVSGAEKLQRYFIAGSSSVLPLSFSSELSNASAIEPITQQAREL